MYHFQLLSSQRSTACILRFFISEIFYSVVLFLVIAEAYVLQSSRYFPGAAAMRTIDVTLFLLVVLVACCSAMKLDLQSLLRHREMYAPAHKRAKDGKEMTMFDVFLGLWNASGLSLWERSCVVRCCHLLLVLFCVINFCQG